MSASAAEWATAASFAVGLLMHLSGSAITGLVRQKVVERQRLRFQYLTPQQQKDLPISAQPESIGDLAKWSIDAAQALNTIITPLVAMILAFGASGNPWIGVLYVAAFLGGLYTFIRIFRTPNPSRYSIQKDPLFLSGALINGVGLVSSGIVALL
jgi:hypothetical protein